MKNEKYGSWKRPDGIFASNRNAGPPMMMMLYQILWKFHHLKTLQVGLQLRLLGLPLLLLRNN